MYRMVCGNCGKGIKFPADKNGVTAKCPACKTPQKLAGARVVKTELMPPKPNPVVMAPPTIPAAPMPNPVHPTPAEMATVAKVAPEPAVDSRLARFISDGQSPKAVGKLLTRVEKICTDSEKLEYIAVQHLPAIASPDAIVLTDRRVIIFRGKALGRMNMVDVPWLDVTDIHISEGIVGASLHVSARNGHTEKIDHLPKEQARSVYRVGQEREEVMREYRRTRKMEEDRNAAGGVVVTNAVATTSPAPANDLAARLSQLKTMVDGGLITLEEFEAKKAEILADL